MADVPTDPLVNVYRRYEQRDGKPPSYPRSWPKNLFKDTKPCADVMLLSEALTRSFRYPAYLTSYAPTEGNRRLSKDILGTENSLKYVGGFVPMQLFLCDVDGPGHNDNDGTVENTDATQEVTMTSWWEQELIKVEKLLLDHPGLFVYRSRGGYRIVGRLVPSHNLSSLVGAVNWTRKYTGWINYLNRKYEIRTYGKETADKLGDWTRLQRVPHDSRDFGTPDTLETIGDPRNVGIWSPEVTAADVPLEPTRALAKVQQDNNAGALLLQLVQNRGLRCALEANDEYDICCPRVAYHSPNESGERDYQGKTRLYTKQGKLGGIKCFSDGCTASHATPGDWLDEFTWQEKLTARRELGRSFLGNPRAIDYESLKLLDVNYNVISIMQDGHDESKPDKTVQQCLHQVACGLLSKTVHPDCILYLLTNEQYAISAHVLAQIDPGWYVEETIAKARERIATPREMIDIEDTKAVVADLIKTTTQNFYALYSFLNRKPDTTFSDDDTDLGKMAVECFGRVRCRFIEGQNNWVIHNGHRWVPGENGRIRTLLGELARCLEVEAKDVSSGLRGPGRTSLMKAHLMRHPWLDESDVDELKKSMDVELDKIRKMAKKLKQKEGLNSVLTMVGDALTITVDDLDTNPFEVIFLNGVWHAHTGDFTRVSPLDPGFPTRSCNIEWREPTTAARERWLSYLGTLGFDDATLGFLQRSFGYALLGRGGEKRFWWFRGETDTGKTTIIELISGCLGTYVEPTPTDLWLAKGGSRPGHTDDLAALRGCRFATADEFPKISRFDDGLMKRCTSGGSPLRVSSKGKTGFEFIPRFGIFLASNYDPQIAEDDAALMRRLTAFTFKVPIAHKSPTFVADFLKEDDQKRAILEWLMAGARDYLANGLQREPEQVKQSRSEYTSGQVSVEDQLAEMIRKEPGGRVSVTMVMQRLADLQQRTRQRCQYTPAQVKKSICGRFGATLDDHDGIKSFIGIALRRDVFSPQPPSSAEPDPDYNHEDAGYSAPGF